MEISEELRAEQLEIIKQFRLIDDTFMTVVFQDKKCAEILLNVILGRKDLVVESVSTQLEIKNLQGRSSRLDIYAVDSTGKQYDVEVQRDNGGADPKRARYNSSLLDANSLKAGADVDNLRENYVIFITEHDVLGGNKPIYTIDRMIREQGNAIFGDGSHIIYVNGEIRDNTELGYLMQDFFCSDPKKMHYEAFAERAGYFKETKEGKSGMCKLMEDFVQKCSKEAEKQAAEQAVAETSRAFAIELWNDGMRDFEKIAKLTKLPLEEVKKLFEGKSA